MADDLASANVNRSYQLSASSIAIFTFQLLFLYPGYARGEINPLPFQSALILMGVATFSFALASFYYYSASLGGRFDDGERIRFSSRGDRLWMLGCVLLFLVPSLVLFIVDLLGAATAWFLLWIGYLFFALRHFPRIQTSKKN